jgi:hypothetical protein
MCLLEWCYNIAIIFFTHTINYCKELSRVLRSLLLRKHKSTRLLPNVLIGLLIICHQLEERQDAF